MRPKVIDSFDLFMNSYILQSLLFMHCLSLVFVLNAIRERSRIEPSLRPRMNRRLESQKLQRKTIIMLINEYILVFS